MGTKSNPGSFDCYANAEPDEPMFVLLGRDKHAPTLVWLWSVLRELDGEEADKVHEARNCAAQMLQWAHAHDRKVVGFAQATLAGLLELIRSVNGAMKALGEKSLTDATDIEIVRRFLSTSSFEPDA